MNDTIAAISTAQGEGAISIIRISGNDAILIADQLAKDIDLIKVNTHTINYGHIYDGDNIIDEVMITVMRAPRTFTKEDVVEINCHGGIAATNKVFELILENGARLAEPGEFTKRAFLNGRIDLSQAEAISDLIKAKSDSARALAINQLSGRVSNQIKNLRDNILGIIANIEVNIDYPEYDDVETITNSILIPRTKEIIDTITNIIEQSRNGQIIKEGIKTIIVGRPNVGKSSLLNRLLNEEKAIVTDIAGTTRDIVEGLIQLGGITLNIIDTAGIRNTEDKVEKIGVEKSLRLIPEADLILVVLDNSQELTSEDLDILQKAKNKPNIVIINKIDLNSKIGRDKLKDHTVIEISTLNNKNIELLEEKIKEIFNLGQITTGDLTYISNVRHIALLKQVNNIMSDALIAMKNEDPIDMVEIDLKTAWQLLGEIIGEEVHDELINELFSKFCLGK